MLGQSADNLPRLAALRVSAGKYQVLAKHRGNGCVSGGGSASPVRLLGFRLFSQRQLSGGCCEEVAGNLPWLEACREAYNPLQILSFDTLGLISQSGGCLQV